MRMRGFFIFSIFALLIFAMGIVFASTTGTLRPTADGGDDSADWTNSGSTACNAADCYTEVDESSGSSCTNSDGDTSYIESSINGANQTFDINESGITNDSTITQIDVTVCHKKIDGGAKIQARYCVGGSCSNSGTDIAPGDSYSETTQSFSGLSITKGASTDIEIGVSNTKDNKTVRVSQISVDITYTLPSDTIAPSAVTDLALSDASDSAITASWTAPGDDGSTGTATTYDLRYSTSEITAGNFSSATQVSGEPTPSVAGTSESKVVSGLSASTLYYFALKTDDEVPNTSDISNLPSLSTTATPDTTAPDAVTDLALSNAQSGSIDLAWTAPGDDGSTGTASSYDVRYSTAEITTGNWSSASTVTGEPTPSVAGSSESMTVSGLTAETTYYFALKTSDEVPNESGLSNVPNATTASASADAGASSGAGGSSQSGGVAATQAKFSGYAYPGSKIELLQKSDIGEAYKNIPIESSTITDDGTFSINLISILQGQYFFALRIEDPDGRKTGIISFDANLLSSDRIEVSNIFVPPTIGFGKSIVAKGEDVNIIGFASPESRVQLKIDGKMVGEVSADTTGTWMYNATTTQMKLGNHLVSASQTGRGLVSNDSVSRTFKVSVLDLPKADFNDDNSVNITDWSVFLFRWGSDDAELRTKIDVNEDGDVDIIDFSLFLKAMTI